MKTLQISIIALFVIVLISIHSVNGVLVDNAFIGSYVVKDDLALMNNQTYYISKLYDSYDSNQTIIFHNVVFAMPTSFTSPPDPSGMVFSLVKFPDGSTEKLGVGVPTASTLTTLSIHANSQAAFTRFINNTFVFLVSQDLGLSSPLKQFKSGIAAKDVKCKGLQLVIKSKDGSPACVKSYTAIVLVERGWAKVLTTENTTLNALENNCGQFYTIPQDNHPNGSETYPVLILKQNSIGCAKLTYTINYNYNDNRSGSVWSQMLNFTDMFHIGKYNYTTHGNSFGVSSIDTMQMFKIKSIPEVVDLAKYPVGSQFTITLIIQPLQNATGFYDYSIEEIPCDSYPLAVGYSPDQVNSTDFSKGMIGMHNHSCANMPYEISSVQVSGMDFKLVKFS